MLRIQIWIRIGVKVIEEVWEFVEWCDRKWKWHSRFLLIRYLLFSSSSSPTIRVMIIHFQIRTVLELNNKWNFSKLNHVEILINDNTFCLHYYYRSYYDSCAKRWQAVSEVLKYSTFSSIVLYTVYRKVVLSVSKWRYNEKTFTRIRKWREYIVIRQNRTRIT